MTTEPGTLLATRKNRSPTQGSGFLSRAVSPDFFIAPYFDGLAVTSCAWAENSSAYAGLDFQRGIF
jgi:hypothetical protein